MKAKLTPDQHEKIYKQCFEAINEACAKVQTLNNVSSDVSPAIFDQFEHARQRFLDAMIIQIRDNMPEPKRTFEIRYDALEQFQTIEVDACDYANEVQKYYQIGCEIRTNETIQ